MKRLLNAIAFPFKAITVCISMFYVWLIITAMWVKHVKDLATDY